MARTKVFLTWSGKRSREVANALRKWLPKVIQNLDPWMSEADIDKGTQWNSAIALQLRQAKIGIICLTPENLVEPWINFEAGALSKLENSYVCTYLLDLPAGEIQYPLAQFQFTKAEKEDTKALLQTINKAIGDEGLSSEGLNEVFERWWSDLEMELSEIVKATAEPKHKQRPEAEVLEELVATVRQNTHVQSTVLNSVESVLALLHEQRLKRENSNSRMDIVNALVEARMARPGVSPGRLFDPGTFSSTSTEDQTPPELRIPTSIHTSKPIIVKKDSLPKEKP